MCGWLWKRAISSWARQLSNKITIPGGFCCAFCSWWPNFGDELELFVKSRLTFMFQPQVFQKAAGIFASFKVCPIMKWLCNEKKWRTQDWKKGWFQDLVVATTPCQSKEHLSWHLYKKLCLFSNAEEGASTVIICSHNGCTVWRCRSGPVKNKGSGLGLRELVWWLHKIVLVTNSKRSGSRWVS